MANEEFFHGAFFLFFFSFPVSFPLFFFSFLVRVGEKIERI